MKTADQGSAATQSQAEVAYRSRELVAAAMRACDHWNDTPAAREEMRRDCLATPAALRSDLIEHFRETYP